MTASRDELVALLHDYADVEPPYPLAIRDGIARRVRRGHRRRAALAGALAVVLGIVTIGVIHAAKGPDVAKLPALSLPAPVFSREGVTYRRVAVVYLDTSRRHSATATIPAGNTPVAVYASCKLARPHSTDVSAVALDTVAAYAASGGQFSCTNPESLVTQVDRSGLPGAGTRLTFTVMDSYADGPADAPAGWAFGIYIAAASGHPAPPPAAPASVTSAGSSYALISTYSGFWPDQRSVLITIPAGKPSVILFECPEPLAAVRIWLPTTEDGEFINGNVLTCAAPDGDTTGAIAELGRQRPPAASTPEPATFTLIFDPLDQSLAGTWVIGVYQQ